MKRIISVIVLLTGLLFVELSIATEFELKAVQSQLSVKINNVPYSNEILSQELKSGLPNQLRIELKLSDNKSVLASRSISYEITYDLWDENYRLKLLHNKDIGFTIGNDMQLKNYISNFSQNNILNLDNISKTELLKLSFRAFLNPVKSEKIRKIQNWMRESNGYEKISETNDSNPLVISPILRKQQSKNTSNTQEGTITRTSRAGPRFQKLFDKILEGNMDEDAIAAQWKSPIYFKSFTIESLEIENP